MIELCADLTLMVAQDGSFDIQSLSVLEQNFSFKRANGSQTTVVHKADPVLGEIQYGALQLPLNLPVCIMDEEGGAVVVRVDNAIGLSPVGPCQ